MLPGATSFVLARLLTVKDVGQAGAIVGKAVALTTAFDREISESINRNIVIVPITKSVE